jgi:hypothetical protein|tara:strand:- start:3914 stop:4159 length:246 start_codon:yes stop_codon:yes gene_type:complete
MNKIDIRPAQIIETSTTPDFVYDISGNKVIVPIKDQDKTTFGVEDESDNKWYATKKGKMYMLIGGITLIVGIGTYLYFKKK